MIIFPIFFFSCSPVTTMYCPWLQEDLDSIEANHLSLVEAKELLNSNDIISSSALGGFLNTTKTCYEGGEKYKFTITIIETKSPHEIEVLIGVKKTE